MTQFPVLNSTSTITSTVINGTTAAVSTSQHVTSFDPLPVILSAVLVGALAIIAFVSRRKKSGQPPSLGIPEVPAG